MACCLDGWVLGGWGFGWLVFGLVVVGCVDFADGVLVVGFGGAFDFVGFCCGLLVCLSFGGWVVWCVLGCLFLSWWFVLLRVLIGLVVGGFCGFGRLVFLVILLGFLLGLCYALVSCCFMGYYDLLVWLVLGWFGGFVGFGWCWGGDVGVFKYCE